MAPRAVLATGLLMAALACVPQAGQAAPGDPVTRCDVSVDVGFNPALNVPLFLVWGSPNQSGSFSASGTGTCTSTGGAGGSSQVTIAWSGSYQASADKCTYSGLTVAGPIDFSVNGQPYLEQGQGSLNIPNLNDSAATLTLDDNAGDAPTQSPVTATGGFCNAAVTGFHLSGQVTMPTQLIVASGGAEDAAVAATETAGAATDPVTEPVVTAAAPVAAPVGAQVYPKVVAPAQDNANSVDDSPTAATLYAASKAKRRRRAYSQECGEGNICQIFPRCQCSTPYQYGQFAAPFFLTKGADDFHKLLACEIGTEAYSQSDLWQKVTYGKHRCRVGFSPQQKNLTAVRNQNGAPPGGDGISGLSYWCTHPTKKC